MSLVFNEGTYKGVLCNSDNLSFKSDIAYDPNRISFYGQIS